MDISIRNYREQCRVKSFNFFHSCHFNISLTTLSFFPSFSQVFSFLILVVLSNNKMKTTLPVNLSVHLLLMQGQTTLSCMTFIGYAISLLEAKLILILQPELRSCHYGICSVNLSIRSFITCIQSLFYDRHWQLTML